MVHEVEFPTRPSERTPHHGPFNAVSSCLPHRKAYSCGETNQALGGGGPGISGLQRARDEWTGSDRQSVLGGGGDDLGGGCRDCASPRRIPWPRGPRTKVLEGTGMLFDDMYIRGPSAQDQCSAQTPTLKSALMLEGLHSHDWQKSS